MAKGDAYARYLGLVKKAKAMGHDLQAIIAELENEKSNIAKVRDAKLAELVFQVSPYPSRECRRSAGECLTAIERILKELQAEKEICT